MILETAKMLWKGKSVVFLLYFVSLALSLFLAVPFYRFLLEAFGTSVTLKPLLSSFDFMLFGDAFRALGKRFSSYLSLLLLLASFYYFLMVFLSGGIMDALHNGRLKFQRFFIFCKRYFWKCLGFAFFNWLIFIVLNIIAGLLFFAVEKLFPSLDHRTAFLNKIPSVLLVIWAIFQIFLVWDYSRAIAFSNPNQDVISNYSQAWKKTFLKLQPYGILFILTLAALFFRGLYLLLEEPLGSASFFLVFLLQQAFIFVSFFIRLLHLKLSLKVVK